MGEGEHVAMAVIDLVKISGIIGSGAVGAIVAVFALTGANQMIRTPNRDAKVQALYPLPVSHVDGITRTLRVGRSNDLSFHIVARINGKPVRMLVDTGANITVLTPADANRVGIPPIDTGQYTDVTGISKAIRHFRNVGNWQVGLGPIGLVDVPISVDDSGEIPNSILGQDAFCNIDQISIEDNAISFVHHAPLSAGCTTGPMHNLDQQK
jgi:clan AA aspartic protease (TIGR02281 family)